MKNPTPHGQVPDAHNTTAIPGAAAEQLFIPAGWNKAGGSNPPLYTAAQVAALTAAPGVQSLSDGQIASACMSYRHDFGLLEPDERAKIMFTAREWERAFSKEREWTAPAQPVEGAANVAKPAESEHVAGDVSKNGAGEVVYQASYQDGFWQDCSRERYEYLMKAPKISSLADWTLRILYTTPQPTQSVPPAGREPLTAAQVSDLLESAGYWSRDPDFINGIRYAEAAHGIKGGQQ